tara:strand:+ start:620 stop:928 length:309 start_codon:yes stop_codon:yes gene_type:complete
LGLTFFGLTSDTVTQTRAAIFQQIHQIVFHGKGGYNWKTVYTMPIWLRRFTFNEIQKFYDEETKSNKTSSNPGSKTVIGADGKVNAPQFLKGAQNKRPSTYK